RAERRRVAVVDEAQVELRAQHGGKRPLFAQPGERARDLGEDVELQRTAGRRLPGRREATHYEDAACVEVDRADARLDERQVGAGREPLRGVARVLDDEGALAPVRPADAADRDELSHGRGSRSTPRPPAARPAGTRSRRAWSRRTPCGGARPPGRGGPNT